jgi:hypothetical protein
MGLSSKRKVADSDYLLERAEAEVQLVEKARSEQAAATHQKLASAYFDRLFSDGSNNSLKLDRVQVLEEKRAAFASVFKWPRAGGDQEQRILSELLEELDSKVQPG